MQRSIILKVQAEAQDRNVPLASILSRARIAARRLALPGVPAWLDKEVDGYAPDDDLPAYRLVPGHHEFANPQLGWRPLVHEDGPPALPLRHSVYDLEELLHNSPAGFLTTPGRPVRMIAYGSTLDFHTRYRIRNIDVLRALASVRRLVLDWTIALESAGVLGDGTAFTPSERTEAYLVTQNFIAQNQSIGVAGNVSGGTNTIAPVQSADDGIDIRRVREFLAETSGLVGNLPAALRDDMRDAVAEAQAEAGKPAPDARKVGKALAVIKDLGMRAGGSVIATGIVEGVKTLAP
ncbi:AbiTii domain-containing protein [Methylorubrum aminovorans]